MEINIFGWVFLICSGAILLLGYLIVVTVQTITCEDWKETKTAKMIGLVVFIAYACFACTFGGSKVSEVKASHWNNFSYNIVSLERSSEVAGRFILGTGSVESTQYYYFYQDLGNNNYKLGNLNHKYTYIHEYTDSEAIHTPCIYEWKEPNTFSVYYTIYVPVNTIIKEYHI